MLPTVEQIVGSRVCACCKAHKSSEEFYLRRNGSSKTVSYCKSCECEKSRYARRKSREPISRFFADAHNTKILTLLLVSKVCPRCNVRKGRDGFFRANTTGSGFSGSCKACSLERKRNMPQEQLDRQNATRRKNLSPSQRAKGYVAMKLRYASLTPEEKEKRLDYGRQYRKVNRERLTSATRLRVRNRIKSDPLFRLVKALRSRLTNALRYSHKSASSMELLGATPKEIKRHIELQFRQGMTWENRGSVWHVDHIKPCASFDLSNSDQQLACFHYTNLQPLFAEENMAKGAKILC